MKTLFTFILSLLCLTALSSTLYIGQNMYTGMLLTTLDSDYLAWQTNVITSGGSIPNGLVIPLNTFFTSLKTSGNWASIYEMGCFAGGTNMGFATNKMKWISVNSLKSTGYSVSDLKTNGFLGNGSGHLDTSFSCLNISNNAAWGTYQTTVAVANNSYRGVIGSSYDASGNSDRFYLIVESYPSYSQVGLGNISNETPDCTNNGMASVSYSFPNLYTYTNGTTYQNLNYWNGLGAHAGTMYVMACGSLSTKRTVSFWFIATNTLNQATFSTSVNNLMSAMGCNAW